VSSAAQQEPIATESANLVGFQNAPIVEANKIQKSYIELLECLGKLSIIYDWIDPGYSRQSNI